MTGGPSGAGRSHSANSRGEYSATDWERDRQPACQRYINSNLLYISSHVHLLHFVIQFLEASSKLLLNYNNKSIKI